MKPMRLLLLLLLLTAPLCAATRYVALNGAHMPPFTNGWASAASNMQAAIDVALPGDTVLVSNGVYAAGTRVTPGYALLNRVCVTQSLTLASLNGPGVTVIVGAPDPVTSGCGDNGVRGIYMDAGWLIGFTISGGYTRTSGHGLYDACGGGIFSFSAALHISNCVICACAAFQQGGGVYTYGGTAEVCVISGNAAPNNNGGGVAYTVLDRSDIRNNVAKGYGGGAHVCLVRNCTVTANRAGMWGGGLFGGYAWQCTIAGNVAQVSGGGVAGDTYTPGSFANCIITGNIACLMGGGMNQAGVANSVISGNRAWYGGGSAYGGVNNCTITGNQAVYGGGTHHGNIYNSIIYQNDAAIDANCNQPTEARYCCTTPYVWGTGNISNDPQMASASHVASTTPCGGKGASSYVSGTDIDGEVWGTPPTIGCDEYRSGSITGVIGVAIGADTLQPPRDWGARFTAEIAGRLTRSIWSFDDGLTITNQPWVSHAWSTLGPHTITLRAFNEAYPDGVATSIVVTVVEQPVQYADAANTSGAAWPYTSWVTAATNIQDAVDAAAPGGLVLVADGEYTRGGRPAPWSLATNRIVILQNVTVRSVHGPAATVVVGAPDPATGDLGDRAVRGVWMDAGTLSGFTISNGHTATSGNDYLDRSGGGVSAFGTSPCISNCVISGCGAANAGGGASWGTMYTCTMTANHCGWGSGGSYTGAGGGAYAGLRYDCTLSDNRVSAYGRGGGAYGGTLERCLLRGNYAESGDGGGAAYATLTACLIVSNSTSEQGGGVDFCSVNACTVALNRAEYGGGVNYLSTANDCLIISNYASVAGGGAYFSTLNRCAVIDNVASNVGGGTAAGTINLCVLRGNRAIDGGGVWNGTLNNCLITDNSASGWGGGAYCGSYQYVSSCTLSGNRAAAGAGVYVTNGYLRNCIAYFNGATNWAGDGSVVYCCTTPLPLGPGNISNDPQFINSATGNYHVFESSPCINAGTNAYITWSTDLDGTPRSIDGRVDMGCYEFTPEPAMTWLLMLFVGQVRRIRRIRHT